MNSFLLRKACRERENGASISYNLKWNVERFLVSESCQDCHWSDAMERFSACFFWTTIEVIVEHLRSTSSSQDIIPSLFLKQIFNTVGHELLLIFNTNLITVVVPDCLKTATVTQLLKSLNLDFSNLYNFRPISNLPFLSKILEKVALSQHSTETAVLKVLNIIYMET